MKPELTDNQSASYLAAEADGRAAFAGDTPVFGPALPTSSNSPSDYAHSFAPPAASQLSWQPMALNNGELYQNLAQDSDYGAGMHYGSQSSALLDPSLMTYGAGMGGMMSLQGDSPTSSSFAAPGLPFPGLDFIRNYTPGVYDDSQDALWQGFDGGEFRFDPELQFSLGELPTDGNS